MAARRDCDFLIVAINSDASTARLKGEGRPLVPFSERRDVVAALRPVDLVCELREERPLQLIGLLQPDVYFKGGDYEARELRSAPAVEAYGGRVRVLDVGTDISSTRLRERIASSESIVTAPRDALEPAPGLILDRDGTLVEPVPYLADPERVRLLPGAVDVLRALGERRYRLCIVTNQQGLGLGYLDWDSYYRVNGRMLELLGAAGVFVSRVYTCPHSLADGCDCRKPSPALYELALSELALDRATTWVIGDRETDVAPARELGLSALRLGSEGWHEVLQKMGAS